MTMRLLVILLAAGSALMGAAAFAGEDCIVPHELIEDDPKLPITGEHLQPGQRLKIVAIGGGSTAGAAAGMPEKAWPKRLEETLAAGHPGATVTVLNKGVARQTAQEMVARFERDVVAEQPTLVIWETGTTDAVRGVDVDEFSTVLQNGIEFLRAHHIEAMLVDMQFSRATASVINFERYLDALRRIADVNDVFVFRRYDIMRYWSEHTVFNFDEVAPAERAALASRAYECLAHRLAEAIEFATQ